LAGALFTALLAGVAACATAGTPQPAARVPVRVCVIVDGRLAEVQGEYGPTTGDTLVAGVPLAGAGLHTRAYAGGAEWFVSNEPIPGEPRPDARGAYVKYGRQRQMPVSALRYVGEHQGVGLYTEAENTERFPGVIYVPVQPGCWVQSYQYEGVGSVRDGR
jgi:hypothetical protein